MPDVTRDQRHTRANRCRICDGADEDPRGIERRCSGFDSDDGVYCRCSRIEYAGNLSPGADGLYRHMMRGYRPGDACKCGQKHGPDAPSLLSEPEAIYDYVDEKGQLIFQVLRMPGKKFKQRKPDSLGGWIWKLNGSRRVLYRLPEILSSTGTVYLVEGEKDVETLRAAGYVATTSSNGANGWKQSAENAAQVLRGRDVIVIRDKDEAGLAYVTAVAKTIGTIAKSFSIVECTRGKDVSDHIAAGGTLDELVPMNSAKPASPVPLRILPPPPTEPPWRDDEGPPPPGPDGKPEIVMSPRVHEIIDELERHLATLDSGLFQRGRELVTVLGSDSIRGVADGTPVIRPLNQAAILPRITQHVQFISITPPNEKAIRSAQLANFPSPEPGRKHCVPTAQLVVQPLLARGEWPNIRLLKGITETPLLRADGSILQTRGYDPATRYLYSPTCEYLPIPDSPSQSEARAALETLRALFVHFPFTSPAGSVVAIAALLTVLARPAIDGPVPTFVFEASVRGSGKTLQCDVVHLIATGRSAPHAEWPADEDEQKKTMNSLALSGASLVILDNVKGLFGGATLEGTLTSERVSFRVLGSKDTADIPWQSVILASGNNIQLTDDMLRRVLISRLEPVEDDPTTRKNLPDLPTIVRAERPKLVQAALTILRSYTCHGSPDAGARLASYQPWAALVANAILYAGGPNVIDARPGDEKAASDDVTAAASIVCGLPILLGSAEGLTTKAILSRLYPPPGRNDPPDGYDDLREAIETLAPMRGPVPDALLLGKRLRKFVGRWFGTARLVAKRDSVRNTTLWALETRKDA